MPERLPLIELAIAGAVIAALSLVVAMLGAGLAAFLIVPALAAPVVILALRARRQRRSGRQRAGAPTSPQHPAATQN